MPCGNSRSLIIAATLLGPIVIIFVVLAFATDNWVEVTVDRYKLNTVERILSNTNQHMARIFHTRNKGIIRECYTEDSALFMDIAQNVVADDCFFIEFDDPEGADMSSAYKMRMHLLRGVLATYVLGIVAVMLTFIVGLILCFARNCHVAHVASCISWIGALFIMCSIVLFHATEYVEANKDGQPGEVVFHNTWSKRLLMATDSDFGYSYALAWIGFILTVADSILYLLASRALRIRDVKEDRSSTGSISGSSTTERHTKGTVKSEIYDNYAMAYGQYPAVGGPTMVMEGYPPTFMQAMPHYPAVTYGNSYKMSDDDA